MSENGLDEKIEAAVHLLRGAHYAVAFTGAGISTPSGIPDFRSQSTGLWTKVNPLEVASLTAFRRKPERFFNWLRPLLGQIMKASPNPAHQALAKMEQAGIIKAVITQNIDGLHQKAGSNMVLEVHGSAGTLSCMRCKKTFPVGEFTRLFVDEGQIPLCRDCKVPLKPDIVLYEEMLPYAVWSASETHCRLADLMVVVGSSLEVVPASNLPLMALEGGADLIIVNLDETYLDRQAKVVINADAALILPQLAAGLG
jgi:NAD-dependent deacetylase